MFNNFNLYKNLPNSSGVYLMKNAAGEIIYVGKAGNLKKRVSSYFLRPQDGRVSMLVREIVKIDYKKTDTVIEALILEAELIKKYSPKYNIKDKDNKSFLYVEITKEEFPRVILAREKDLKKESDSPQRIFGPYTSASSIREALKIIRKIFPYSLHRTLISRESHSRARRPCFDYEIGLCPGVCAGFITRKEYLKNIRNMKLLFQGKKKQIFKNLEKEMKKESREQEFEKAEKLRRQIFALKHINDVALINEAERINVGERSAEIRIEGYDISNISGASAVGSMIVFVNGAPLKNEYRKFKIKTVLGSDDVGMLREILFRRFSRHKSDWHLPNLVLIDGGKPQVNATKNVLDSLDFKIPIIGVAKGAERKKNEIIGKIPKGISEETLISVRDEAHRFAITYHKKLRGREFIK